MNSSAMDLKDYLVANTALSFATNLFIGFIPDNDIMVTGLFDSPGSPPSPNNIQNPVLQVMVRGTKNGYQTAFAQIELVTAALHKLRNTTINSTRYILVYKMNEPYHVGNDSQARPIFSCTLTVQRT